MDGLFYTKQSLYSIQGFSILYREVSLFHTLTLIYCIEGCLTLSVSSSLGVRVTCVHVFAMDVLGTLLITQVTGSFLFYCQFRLGINLYLWQSHLLWQSRLLWQSHLPISRPLWMYYCTTDKQPKTSGYSICLI